MIITVNSATDAFIVWDTLSQQDVENTISWLAGEDNPPEYCVTLEIEGWNKTPIIKPCVPHDPFIEHLIKSFIGWSPDDPFGAFINEYVEFWKNRSPIKEFFASESQPSPLRA